MAQTILATGRGSDGILVSGFLPGIPQSSTFTDLRNHPPECQLRGFKRLKAKLQPGPPPGDPAVASKLGWQFSRRCDLACWGRLGRHVGGTLSPSCPCPQAPSTPGKKQTGPRVAANGNNNTVMFMEPLALGTRSPHPHGLARCILGRAGMKRLCLAGDVDLLPKVACLPFLLGAHPEGQL